MGAEQLVDAFKNMAENAGQRGMPAMWFFGVVMALEPLTIMVDSQFPIVGDEIVVMQQFKYQQEYDDHWHTIEPVDTTVVDKHKHQTEPHITHIAYWRGLQVGDKVVLLRNAGGQQYLVIGRV